MELTIRDLETACPKCQGAGDVDQDGERLACDKCHGLGTILTAQGQVILHIVRKYEHLDRTRLEKMLDRTIPFNE